MLSKEELRLIRASMDKEEERLASVFEVLGDQTRLNIVRLLLRGEDLCVTDIAHTFNISVPAASYHLRLMEMAGLVRKDRMGKTTCYELRKEDSVVKNLLQLITRVGKRKTTYRALLLSAMGAEIVWQ